MHVISQKRIWDAKKEFPTSATALDGWYRVMKGNEFSSFAEIKNSFRSVDKVKNFHVFNIGGNKLRLITVIHFERARVYVRNVLTHSDYEKGNWLT